MLLNLLILWDSLLSFSWPADQQLLKMSLAKHFNWNPSSQQTEYLTRCTPNFIQREKSLSGRLRSRQPSGELVFCPALCFSPLVFVLRSSSSLRRYCLVSVLVLSLTLSDFVQCLFTRRLSSSPVCLCSSLSDMSVWRDVSSSTVWRSSAERETGEESLNVRMWR